MTFSTPKLALPGYASPFTIIEPNADMLQILPQYAQLARRWWKASLIVGFLVVPAGGASGQNIVQYKHVSGKLSFEKVGEHVRGTAIEVQPISQRDTLTLWIEGVSLTRAPEWDDAEEADLVVWCYPDRYPDDRHILPEAEEIFIVQYRHSGETWIAVGPRSKIHRATRHIDLSPDQIYYP